MRTYAIFSFTAAKLQQSFTGCMLFIVLLSLAPSATQAQIPFLPETFSKLFYGSSLTSYSNPLDTVSDDKYTDLINPSSGWQANYKHRKVRDRITVRIIDPSALTAAFSYRFLLKVDRYDINGTHATFNVPVEVSYDATQFRQYRNKAVYEFTGAHRFVCTILSVTDMNTNLTVSETNLKKNFSIEEEVLAERYYRSSYDTGIDSAYLSSSLTAEGKIVICWNEPAAKMPGQYELEWMHVDDYKTQTGQYLPASSMRYDFRNNATRVRISGTCYVLEDVFESGWLLYRVRKVRPDSVYFTYEKFSSWSPAQDPAGIVSAYGKKVKTTAHQHDSLNWNYEVTYIEDGKRKDAVGYYDGLLKSRQQVTVSNTDTMVIVGESKYDQQGRAAVQILPVPAYRQDTTGGKLYEKKLRYYGAFNRNATGVPYSAADFDSLATICPADTSQPLSSASGAGKYYSSSNPDRNAQQKFVPDAAGYPMTQVEYMPDQTGRLRRQSGTGPVHQLGKGKETSFTYEMPVQQELDRIFGSEAGIAAHYKKESVRDPNGQVSVKYLDMQGRVIATALLGESPANLEALPENRPANVFIDNLKKNNLEINRGIELSYPFTLVKQGPVYVDYRMSTSLFRDACLPASLCFNCVYNYEISLVNTSCQEVVFTWSDTIGFLNPVDSSHYGQLSNYKLSSKRYGLHSLYSQVDTTNLDSLLRVLALPAGSYTLSKRLAVNPGAYKIFSSLYAKRDTCRRSFNDFLDDAIDDIDFSGCNPCDTCDSINYCGTMLDLMKADVRPGGQYFTYVVNDDDEGTIEAGDDETSVLYADAYKSTNHIVRFGYRNAETAAFIPDADGNLDSAGRANVNTFVKYFNSDWADTLVKLHPEYCFYRYCTDSLSGSYDFDISMSMVNSYDSAYDAGFMNPSATGGLKYSFPSGLPGSDPLFSTRPALKNRMNDLLRNFKMIRGRTYSAWDIAALEAFCGPLTDDGEEVYACLEAFSNPMVVDSLFFSHKNRDRFWSAFRAMYIAVKTRITDSLMTRVPGIYAGNTEMNCSPCLYDPAGTGCGKYAGKQRRFSFGYMDGLDHNKSDSLLAIDIQAMANDSFAADSLCDATALFWLDQLKNCPYITPELWDSLRVGFIQVCQRGRMVSLPASAYPVSEVPASDTLARFHSLDAVLQYFLGEHYTSRYCNSSLLSMAYSYKHNYVQPSGRACNCVAAEKIQPPAVALIAPADTTYSTTCLRDTIAISSFATALEAFLTELNAHHQETGNFDYSSYTSYSSLHNELPYEVFRGSVINRTYPGALASKNAYEWWLNFLDDTTGTALCNVVLKISPSIQTTIFSFTGTYSNIRPVPSLSPDSFLVTFYFTRDTGPDSLVIPGATHCKRTWTTYCVEYKTDTIYGTPAPVDSSKYNAFFDHARMIRAGQGDTLLAAYLKEGECGNDTTQETSGGSPGYCRPRISDRTRALVSSVNEALYSTRMLSIPFTIEKDTLDCSSNSGLGGINQFMLTMSPTYAETFGLDWSNFNGYAWSEQYFDSLTNDVDHDCFADNNIFHDPYFCGAAVFGIDACAELSPEVHNCTLSFGDPYGYGFIASQSGIASLKMSDIDSMYGVYFDTETFMVMVKVRMHGQEYRLSVKSCEDDPGCNTFYAGNTAKRFRTFSLQDTRKTYTFSCYSLEQYYRRSHDNTCPNLAIPEGEKCQYASFFFERLMYDMARQHDGSSNYLASTTYHTFDSACSPDRLKQVIDTFGYRADIIRDSMLIAYIGNPSSNGAGCQLSLRRLGSDTDYVAFGDIDSIASIRPDDERIAEYMKRGEIEKGTHFFLLNAIDTGTGDMITLRGWVSCIPVFDCITEYAPAADSVATASRCACLTCPEVKFAIDSFHSKYPGVIYGEPAYKVMLAHFLNDQLNNNLSYFEYDEFMHNCNLFESSTCDAVYCDYRLEGSFNENCLHIIDTLVEQFRDSLGYTVAYTKWKNEGNSNVEICFHFGSMDAASRLQFIHFLHDSVSGIEACSRASYTEDTAYVTPCHIWVDFTEQDTFASSCSRTEFETQFAAVITEATLPEAEVYKHYYEPYENGASSPYQTVYHYCIAAGELTVEQKNRIYNVIDSLLGHCTMADYGTNYQRNDAAAADSAMLCISRYDTAYTVITDAECISCKTVYNRIIAYQDETWKLNKELIREALLPENVQTYFFNRYGEEVQVYEQDTPCATCPAKALSICAPSPQATDLMHLLQYLTASGKLYQEYDLTGDTMYTRTTLNTSGSEEIGATYTADTLLSGQLHINIATLVAGSCNFYLSGDTSIHAIDTIFAIQSVPGNAHAFLLSAGARGQRVTYTGTSDCFTMSGCCMFPKPALCFRAMSDSMPDTGECRRALMAVAHANAASAWRQYSDSLDRIFSSAYERHCLDSAWAKEKTGIGKEFAEYHFTLYYYDMGGNLIKTVPPKGVDTLLITPSLEDQLNSNRDNWQAGTHVFTQHTLASVYRYNSLNQPVFQHSPDGDTILFYYDALGRLVLSQNRKQSMMGNVYAYTIRDVQNRVVEVGEVAGPVLNEDSLSFAFNAYFSNWLGRGRKTQITRTVYDTTYSAAVSDLFAGGQQRLRTRVSTVAYFEYDIPQYRYATHYSYDIHGNVSTLIQDYPELETFGNRYKRISYTYDLISGKVNTVSYQPGQPDRFYHSYRYDADNRLLEVYTSSDSMIWDNDAAYSYYRHGPLARMALGEHHVQGVDYAYTIHGWLKGINSNTLDSTRDMGQDGNAPYALDFASDVYGFTLGYFNGDYKPIDAAYYNTASSFMADVSGSPLAGNDQLYNGNISHMVTAVKPLLNAGKPLASLYHYDQLNRLTRMETYSNVNLSSNAWNSGSSSSDYLNTYAYDPNGNILRLYRAGLSTATHPQMDSLAYYYDAGTNRLNYVHDGTSASYYPADIDNQSAGNYRYDRIGNLVKDHAEEIDTILWNVYGKMITIRRDSSSTKPALSFRYDASGQRAVKVVKRSASENDWASTYYVRDAQGNVMATYNSRSYINGDLSNFTAVTDWIVYYKGQDSLIALMQSNFASEPAFVQSYIDVLLNYGIQGDVLAHYTAGDLMLWDPPLLQDFMGAFGTLPSGKQQDLVTQLMNYNEQAMLAGLLSCDREGFLTALLSDPTLEDKFYQGMCGSYTALLGTICSDLGLSPLSATCSSYYAELESYGDKHAIALELIAALDDLKISGLIYNSIDLTTLTMFLNSGAYGMSSIFYAVANCVGPLVLDFFDDTYDDPTTALSVLVGAAGESYLLNLIADHDIGHFIEYSIEANYPKLSEALIQVPGFTIAQYMNLVKVRWGQTDYNSLAAGMIYTQELKLAEHHLYGSSRLGVRYADTTLVMREITITGFDSTGSFLMDDILDSTLLTIDTANYYRTLARKQYEMTDHLSNVLASVYDRHTPKGSTTIVGYNSDVIAAQYYYPFGQLMKMYSGDTVYKDRFGFNGQEADNEVSGAGNTYTAEYWEYDARLGRRWNIDPAFGAKPWMSPYHAFSNKPIINIDPNGAFDTRYEDEDGNLLADTKDGNNSTVTVTKDQRERFDMFKRIGESTGKIDDRKYNMFMINEVTSKDKGLYFTDKDFGIDYMRYSHEASKDRFNPSGTEVFGYSTTDGGMVVLPTQGVNANGRSFENYGHGSDPEALPLTNNTISIGGRQFMVNASYHTHPNNSSFSGFPIPLNVGGKIMMMPSNESGDAQAYASKFFTQTNKITNHYVIGKSIMYNVQFNTGKSTFTAPTTINR